METERFVKEGFLLLPPHGVLSQLMKAWQRRYCRLFNDSKHGIKRLEIWDNPVDCHELHLAPRLITLEACVKITPTNPSNFFVVITKTGEHQFGCCSDTEFLEWIDAFQQVAFKNIQTVNSCNIEEENDLYYSSGDRSFPVRLVETDASKRCGLSPKMYTLMVTPADIRLMDGNAVLYIWPYRWIRKYGHKVDKFTFEVGRQCLSGEGYFELEHGEKPEIYTCVVSRLDSIKLYLRGEGLRSSTVKSGVSFDDHPYHAALSMEVGSRAGVAFTPELSAMVDLDASTRSQSSQKSYYSTCSSMDTMPFIKPLPPVKPKPTKPPRKCVFPPFSDKKINDTELPCVSAAGKYTKLHDPFPTPELSRRHPQASSTESINGNKPFDEGSYDVVEVREEAWKTQGVYKVHHTERSKIQPITSLEKRMKKVDLDKPVDKDDEESFIDTTPYDGSNSTDDDEGTEESFRSHEEARYEKSAVENAFENITVSPIIHNNQLTKSNSIANYDKLQHLGSTYKLNSNPGYRCPNVTPSIAASSQSLLDESKSWNDYDIVDEVCGIRLADDSSRGYGVIKKKTSLTGPNHTVINNSEYAIVSKPKRV